MLKNILFVTDNCEYEKEYTIKNRDSEGNTKFSRDEMIDALKLISKNVQVTYSLKEANKLIQEYPDIFVVTTYYGTASPDSKSLLPAICSANHVKYWGADSYTQMICNDKYLSKSYIKEFGLNPAPGNIFYSPNNPANKAIIHSMEKPLIVKPNFGGGSNGIANKSLTHTDEETIAMIKELYKYQKMPILVEKYISGYEVSLVIIGNKKEILFCEESELLIQSKNYFDNEIFGLENKKVNTQYKAYRKSNHIDKKTREKIIALFQSFDKVEFMRADCRITSSGQIFIIELSPDCYVGTKGAFYETVKQMGISFPDMIKIMIDNSINNQNY